MKSAIATYRAPPGDSKVCEMGGVTFFDGQPVELNSVDHAHMMSKLPGNKHFDYEEGEEDNQPATVEKKRGRPSNADKAAAQEASEKAAAEANEAKADKMTDA